MVHRDDSPWKIPLFVIVGGGLVWGSSSIVHARASGASEAPDGLVAIVDVLRWLGMAVTAVGTGLALVTITVLLIVRARQRHR
ncbi:hypothetical protein PS9374_04461 [Planomonospora sphaerica]|uniref:Uncharacterized protein n=1 Tax=Planomonospora sphaerica TaxID=161355 RepID=A0A171DIT8_9ACTN|nr:MULTISPECIES: hypothetical protein [Planomonospora]GAT68796.1 hypothetical protein PS9374_04461 [Planomonospora sphaerica]GGL55361.1 hypothetical protein GCM10014719_65830 [Planomonospora parontospora subsp. antibiotica]GII19809.1 hypothetical protein Ppa05_65350 [Planomonospora parontospora subsp. antibiotica]